jgi:hypothetical protein
MFHCTKGPSRVDRVLVAAAFGFVALVVVFGRPLSHSHRPANSVATGAMSAPANPVTTGLADKELASTGMPLAGSPRQAARRSPMNDGLRSTHPAP